VREEHKIAVRRESGQLDADPVFGNFPGSTNIGVPVFAILILADERIIVRLSLGSHNEHSLLFPAIKAYVLVMCYNDTLFFTDRNTQEIDMAKFVDFALIKENMPFSKTIPALELDVKQSGNQWRGACPTCKSGGDRALVITEGKG
jgi:hypothetical protein